MEICQSCGLEMKNEELHGKNKDALVKIKASETIATIDELT